MFLTTTIATLTLLCSPQPDKQIKHTCIIWMKECIYNQQVKGDLDQETSIEVCIEGIPEELWPK